MAELLPKIVLDSGTFIFDNLLGIIIVIAILGGIAILIIINNITFPKEKTKVDKVIVIEKMSDIDKFKNEANNNLKNSNTCSSLPNKEGCCSLGTCVWATAIDKKEKISKCVLAASTNSAKGTLIPGSNGPEDKCYKNKSGNFLPWEEYWYQDGSNLKSGKGISAQECNKFNGI